MSTVINTNPAATIASYNLKKTSQEHERSLNRLSSGSRINSSYDDAAGLAVSMKMDSQIRNLDALDKNLANAKSFLETQDGALRIVAKILQRIEELEVLKKDVTRNTGDIALYDTEIAQLQDEFTNIRESTFNGVRLFSPTKDMDSIPASTYPLDSSEINLYRPPLPFKTDPLEVVFIVDRSGSMTSYWDSVKNNIDKFVDFLNANPNIKNWSAKIVGYPDPTNPASGLNHPFVNDAASLRAQVDALPQHSVGQGEPLIEALDAVVNSGWSSQATSKKAIIAITDEPITETAFALSNRNQVAQEIKNQNIDFSLLTEGYSGGSASSQYNYLTDDLISESGGRLLDLTDSFSQPTNLFTNLASQVATQQAPVTLDLVAQYIAQNGATQSEINTAIDRTKTNSLNLTSAKSRILDVDVAQESSQLARTKVLLEAGTAMLAQANQSTQSILRLLQLN
jgi:flagellin